MNKYNNIGVIISILYILIIFYIHGLCYEDRFIL